MKTKIFTLLFILLANIGTFFASDTKVDGIWYDFDETTKTASVTYKGTFGRYDINRYKGSIVIPSSVVFNGEAYIVTGIGNEAFAYCDVTSITCSNTITTIGDKTFWDCKTLSSIILPNSVSHIGEDAFYNCKSLTSITLPNSMTSISKGTFRESGLISVVIPENVINIGLSAFSECKSLTNVSIPSSVTNIEQNAFLKCESLVSISVLSSVGRIDNGAFCGCTNLTSVNMPKVKEIRGGAFSRCTNLTNVQMPNIIGINAGAFHDCISLTAISLSDSLEYIGDGAFENCVGLTAITIPKNLYYIAQDAFNGCTNLSSIVWNVKEYNHTQTQLFNNQFAGNITSFVFGADVEMIPNNLCEGMSSLTTVEIPKNIRQIQNNAFKGCSAVTDIYSYTNPNNLVWADKNCDDFIESPSKSTICHVPSNYLSTYKEKWDTGNVSSDVNVTFVGDLPSTESIEDIEALSKESKILRNGQVLILCGEKVYTLQGEEVK